MLSVQLPQEHPLAFVSVQPMPGWEIETTTRTLVEPLEGEGESITDVVDTITWTASGDTQIAPGEFELFWISAGQMPTDVSELVFPAVQTYSSGEEVAWIEETPEGGAEPELPAPTLQLVAADGGSEEATAAPTADDEDDGSDALSIVALVVGALGPWPGWSRWLSHAAPEQAPRRDQIHQTVDRRSRRSTIYSGFCQTEIWLRLVLVKGSRFQSLHRSRKAIPATRAMRSNSDGHTLRNGTEKVFVSPSTNQ